MTGLIVAFAGLVGTGKSELSMSVGSALGWPRASFGDYIRSVAANRNVEITRQNLQALGEAIILEQGWENYCRSVLAQVQWRPGQSVVLDGLRHAEALVSLKQIALPMDVLTVLLELDDAVRRSRLRTRDGRAENDLEQVDSHSTEIQVAGVLKKLADFAIDSDRPVNELTSIIVDWIRARTVS